VNGDGLIGLIGRGDGGSRLLLLFLKSAGRIIFFREINMIRGALQHSGGFLLAF